jgi:hypothetical protein
MTRWQYEHMTHERFVDQTRMCGSGCQLCHMSEYRRTVVAESVPVAGTRCEGRVRKVVIRVRMDGLDGLGGLRRLGGHSGHDGHCGWHALVGRNRVTVGCMDCATLGACHKCAAQRVLGDTRGVRRHTTQSRPVVWPDQQCARLLVSTNKHVQNDSAKCREPSSGTSTYPHHT